MAVSHGSNTDVVGNGYILSQFLNTASLSGKRDIAETTTFKKTSKTFIPGLKDSTMALAGVWDGAVGAIDEIFYAALNAGKGLFSYIPQGYEVVGRTAWTMDAISIKHDVNTAIGGVAQISADFASASVAADSSTTRGMVGHPMNMEAALGNSANLDNTVISTTNGGCLVVHAMDVSASLIVFLQDSADGTTFADLAGSVVVPSNVRTSVRLPITGTIRRYTRIRWTGTGQFLALTERY